MSARPSEARSAPRRPEGTSDRARPAGPIRAGVPDGAEAGWEAGSRPGNRTPRRDAKRFGTDPARAMRRVEAANL